MARQLLSPTGESVGGVWGRCLLCTDNLIMENSLYWLGSHQAGRPGHSPQVPAGPAEIKERAKGSQAGGWGIACLSHRSRGAFHC